MDGKARRAPPPLQLVTGDRYNLTLGVAAAFCLAAAKDQPNLPPFAHWSLNAYTNWNLAFIALRVLANQQQWDPFLLTNSVGIVLGFRTAFCQGLDENMRKKIRGLGLPLPRWLFVALDHLCHTVPPIVLLAALLRRKQRVPRMNSVYTLFFSTWFAFRQNAMLDASELYVPHPWKRAWAGITAGVLATPPFVDACIDRSPRRIALYAALLLAPWLSARLDPNLRLKYNFECRLSEAQNRRKEAEDAAERKRAGGGAHRGGNRSGGAGGGAGSGRAAAERASIPRAASEAPLLRHSSSEGPGEGP